MPVGIGALPVPNPPASLSAAAKVEWKRLAPDLVKLGLLRRLDMGAFEARCELYATWRRCQAVTRKGGLSYEHKGLQRQRPEVKLAQDCLRQMRQYDSEFGLTPAARAKVAHVTGDLQPQLPLGDQPQQPQPTTPASLPPGATPIEAMDDDEFFRGPAH